MPSDRAAHAAMISEANALVSKGRRSDAVEIYARIIDEDPDNHMVMHNLAATLTDLGRWAEGAAFAERALRQGWTAPETWLTLGCALEALCDYDGAEHALRTAIKARPTLAHAHLALAQLTWMRTGDAAAAVEAIDASMAQHPEDLGLMLVKSRALRAIGDRAGAYAALASALARAPDDPVLNHAAGETAPEPDTAIAHIKRTLAAQPQNALAGIALGDAHLMKGEPEEALKAAQAVRAFRPFDQHAIALQATAWRLMDDPRYRELYDYERFVSVSRLDVPDGWPSLDAYLSDLARSLNALHTLQAHPFEQSVRGGTQASNLLMADDRAIDAFKSAVAGPVSRKIAELPEGDGPFLSRATTDWLLQGLWSVRLPPGGGHHSDHVHQNGWISSACYVELPDAIEGPQREGWLKFGEPGVPTTPSLEPEHFVKPEPGLLALFPSYMWHGTIPFSGDQPRMTMAFDVIPNPT